MVAVAIVIVIVVAVASTAGAAVWHWWWQYDAGCSHHRVQRQAPDHSAAGTGRWWAVPPCSGCCAACCGGKCQLLLLLLLLVCCCRCSCCSISARCHRNAATCDLGVQICRLVFVWVCGVCVGVGVCVWGGGGMQQRSDHKTHAGRRSNGKATKAMQEATPATVPGPQQCQRPSAEAGMLAHGMGKETHWQQRCEQTQAAAAAATEGGGPSPAAL